VQPDRIYDEPHDMAKAEFSNFYDIQAIADGASPLTMERAVIMLRSLMEDRFQLKLHREVREMPVYALVIAKSGSKLQTTADGVCSARNNLGPAHGIANCNPTTSTAQLAEMLRAQTDRPVLDRTGLTGQYAFRLRWSADGDPVEPNAPPSFFTAVQEQLGLRLEPLKAAVEVLVIDHAERPSEN
jgi:uncharacterized protein (TIGR03435 family)